MRARGSAAVVLTAIVCATLAAPTSAQPPTLGADLATGENLFDPDPTVTATCNPGGTSTITFDASGVATGPYPGTFTESGVLTIGPQPAPSPMLDSGPLVTFEATFTITSVVGTVHGTKEFVGTPVETGFGFCTSFTGVPGLGTGTIASAFSFVRYTAVIHTPSGEAFRDRGFTDVDLNDIDATLLTTSSFNESFFSSLLEPEPIASPGNSGDVKRGKGCGDRNHAHEKFVLCKP